VDRNFAGIADRALDLLEIPHREIVTLLQVGALGGGITGGVGRDRIELAGEPCGKLGKLTLAAADLLQPLDQIGALAVSLHEEPAEDEGKVVRAIIGYGLGERPDRSEPFFDSNPPRGELSNEPGDRRIGLPVSLHIERSVPIGGRCQR